METRAISGAAVLLLAALCLPPGSGALTMGGISVPALKMRGDVAHLHCGYQEDDGEGAGAINVTWFKDGVRFYYAVNQGLNVDITLFDVPGVEVDKEDSGFRSLTLKSVKVNTAGKYRCVTTSARNSVSSQEQSMLVIAPPTADPVISGFREAIWVANGTLEINCTAGKSFPAANITWSVDGKPADHQRLIRWPTKVDEEGLQTARVGLTLQLGPDPSKEEIHVTCEAVVEKTVINTGPNSATRDDLHYRRTTDSKIRPSSGAARSPVGWAAALLVLLSSISTRRM